MSILRSNIFNLNHNKVNIDTKYWRTDLYLLSDSFLESTNKHTWKLFVVVSCDEPVGEITLVVTQGVAKTPVTATVELAFKSGLFNTDDCVDVVLSVTKGSSICCDLAPDTGFTPNFFDEFVIPSRKETGTLKS